MTESQKKEYRKFHTNLISRSSFEKKLITAMITMLTCGGLFFGYLIYKSFENPSPIAWVYYFALGVIYGSAHFTILMLIETQKTINHSKNRLDILN